MAIYEVVPYLSSWMEYWSNPIISSRNKIVAIVASACQLGGNQPIEEKHMLWQEIRQSSVDAKAVSGG